jgi:hypothetical protein
MIYLLNNNLPSDKSELFLYRYLWKILFPAVFADLVHIQQKVKYICLQIFAIFHFYMFVTFYQYFLRGQIFANILSQIFWRILVKIG